MQIKNLDASIFSDAIGESLRMFRPLFAVFLLLMACSSTASAALISADSAFGQDTLTVDTITGLEWLDPFLGVTAGGACCSSYNQVESQLGAGGILEGFRLATRSELEFLFYTSAGISADGMGSDNQIGTLIEMLGDTFSNDMGWATFLATTAFFDDGDPGSAGLASLTVLNGGAFFNGTVNIYDAPQPLDSNFNAFGAWLVRDVVMGDAVEVLEPPAAWLFVLFALLGLLKSRKASAGCAKQLCH